SFASFNEGCYPDDWRGGCEIDSAPAMCDMATNENAKACPKNDCGPRERKDGTLDQPFQAFADGWSGFLPQGTHYIGNGMYASAGPENDRIVGHLDDDGGAGDEPENPKSNLSDRCLRGIRGAKKDEASIRRAVSHEDDLREVANEVGGDWKILAALTVRETGVRNIPQAGRGLGRGYFQIDLGAHPDA